MFPDAPKAVRARIRRYACFVIAALTCVALAACGAASASPKSISIPQAVDTPAPVVVFIRGSGDMAAVSLPIERYLLTPAQNADINHAMWILTGRCMREHGQSFTIPPELTGQWAGSEVARRYGPTDLDEARRYGYHNPSNPGAGTGEPASISALSAGGCRGEAMRELGGGQSQGSQGLAEQIDLQSYQSSARSAQVIAAEAHWSTCMAGHGHHYGTPGDAFNDPTWRRSSTPSQTEVATALDDIRCKWQTNLIGVWVSVETRIQEGEIARHQSELDSERRQDNQELTAAARAEGPTDTQANP